MLSVTKRNCWMLSETWNCQDLIMQRQQVQTYMKSKDRKPQRPRTNLVNAEATRRTLSICRGIKMKTKELKSELKLRHTLLQRHKKDSNKSKVWKLYSREHTLLPNPQEEQSYRYDLGYKALVTTKRSISKVGLALQRVEEATTPTQVLPCAIERTSMSEG